MESFVLSGKASTVFRLIELAAAREEASKQLRLGIKTQQIRNEMKGEK